LPTFRQLIQLSSSGLKNEMPWHASTDVIECVRSRWRRADKNSGGGERWLKDKTVKTTETKRSLETRQKEHKTDIKNKRFDKSALTQHTFDLNHRMDWANSKVLEFESNYYRRRFIESFHINSDKDTMNEKRSDLFPDLYRFMLK